MQQEMKWIGYLQLGISCLLFVLLLSSCKKQDLIITTEDYIYINETPHEIYIYNPLEGSLTIKPLDTGFINGAFRLPSILVLKYDDVKCDTLSFNDTVLNKVNYEAEVLGNEHYQYTYRFTEADYERAIDCE